MPLKTPRFWYPDKDDKISFKEKLLAPASMLYQSVHRTLQKTKKAQVAPIPVICVGNITAGGSGKTPVAIAISKLLASKNTDLNVYFLTRGYGGKIKNAKVIRGDEISLSVGDEPLILSRQRKTIVSPNRYEGALLAHEEGAQCIIMDDGLTNKTIKKDITFMVIDGKQGIGNGKTIPAGPLREPFEHGLQQTDAIIIIGEDAQNIKQKLPINLPVFHATIKADTRNLDKNKEYIAFSGIGLPDKFRKTLKDNEIKIIEFIEFPDHHKYTEKQIERIIEKAHQSNAKVITTEKDYVRLEENQKRQIGTLPIEIEWQTPKSVYEYIAKVLA